MRRITECQAWKKLTKLFDSHTETFGICSAVADLKLAGLIASAVYWRMLARIERYGKRRGLPIGSLFWPLDDKGDKHRTAFCRRQAAALRPKAATTNRR